MRDLDLYCAPTVPISPQADNKKVSISVIGLGYVGAVSCACLADLGHRVLGVDIDRSKTNLIAQGRSPIHEKDLEKLLTEAVRQDLLSTSNDVTSAVMETDVSFVSVGTPTSPDGGCDFRFIEQVAREIGRAIEKKNDFHVVVLRCSVPPGTTLGLMASIISEVSGRKLGQDFGVCFNPEFLREGVAIDDFRLPPKTIIGVTDERSASIVRSIFDPIDSNPILCSVEDAEFVKYVDNVWHATKVCFANEVGRLAKGYGVDSHSVMGMFIRDRKLNISDYYLKPGFAYGGSCLPKEVRAVKHLAKAKGVSLPLIDSICDSNSVHIEEAIRITRGARPSSLAVLGVAFKSGTDDLRESPILEVMAALLDEGLDVRAHDYAISSRTNIAGQMSYVAFGSPGLARLAAALPEILIDDLDQALDGADTVIVTHRDERYASALLSRPHLKVVDLVRLYDNVPTEERYVGLCW